MARKRFSPEQIVAKLREAEQFAQGMTVAQVCRRIGVHAQPADSRSRLQRCHPPFCLLADGYEP